MSAYNIALKPSRYCQYGLVVLTVLPALVLAVTPVPLLWWLWLVPVLLLFYCQCYAQWFALKQTAALALLADGQLRWFGVALPPGRLSDSGLISHYAIRLDWLGEGQRRYRRWIFADQCPDADFRALARVVNQRNWQSAAADTTTSADA